MLRTHLRNTGVGRLGELRGLHHHRSSSPSFAHSNPQRRGDVLVVRARRARSSHDSTAQVARGGLSNVFERRASGTRGRELTPRPQSLPACTHVRLAKDLVVLLDPKRERLIYVLLADGTEKQKLAKVRSLVALTKVKRVWFVADELGQHDNLVYRVHSACKTDCWEVYAGADTFTTTQQMMLQNGMLPVCPATTAMRARIMPDSVDHKASRMRSHHTAHPATIALPPLLPSSCCRPIIAITRLPCFYLPTASTLQPLFPTSLFPQLCRHAHHTCAHACAPPSLLHVWNAFANLRKVSPYCSPDFVEPVWLVWKAELGHTQAV
ncbi:hypothetical protein DUNSADRAFT_5507 [Dunaliella salina]|uniref:Uncharacterized protein n=1 Tax=Dunaliella salina TaxID=3046 RepID=A0ABQ7H7A8_DUNSA|nr:hypothetical protein DUNSADRAFT_5507 [Dunaliella salina]|eukprot:KAF5842740.1 hypothetical protein DUNSADRAFT_5507 [Dunaliella salina]